MCGAAANVCYGFVFYVAVKNEAWHFSVRGFGCALFICRVENITATKGRIKMPENRKTAFERIAELESALLDRLQGEELDMLNDLIEAWTEYCDEK